MELIVLDINLQAIVCCKGLMEIPNTEWDPCRRQLDGTLNRVTKLKSVQGLIIRKDGLSPLRPQGVKNATTVCQYVIHTINDRFR